MDASELKEKFHQLIDKFDDNSVLEDFYKMLSDYQEQKGDILDDLTESQLKQLNESIAQSERGEVKDWAVVKEEIKQWLTK